MIYDFGPEKAHALFRRCQFDAHEIINHKSQSQHFNFQSRPSTANAAA